MRKNKFFAAIAVAIMMAPAALNSLPTNNIKADTIGTAVQTTPTYDANGKASGRALTAGSKWKLGKKITVDNVEYYAVATDTYVAASDLTDITDTTATTTTDNDANTSVGKTMTVKTTTTLVDNNAAAINATLPAGSSWKVGKTMTVNGISYYQVATNEWVKASDMTDQASTVTNNNTYKTPTPGDGLIATLTKAQRVYNSETNSYGTTLPVGSAWKINKLVVNKYGSFWGQVATNQYVWITDTTLNSGLNLKDNSNYVADFATNINK